MSVIESQLQPGEQVLMRVNQGRKWHHFLLLFIEYCVLIPFLFWMLFVFLVPIMRSFFPEAITILAILGLMLLLGISLLFNFIHFLTDDVAITNLRILGRAQGATVFVFRKIDLPLSAIRSAQLGNLITPGVTIQRKDGKPDLLLRNLSPGKQFAAKLTELIQRA